MQISSGGITDVGILREQNEDSFIINKDIHLFMVADGMGGHVAGGRASSLAVQIVETVVKEGLAQIASDDENNNNDTTQMPTADSGSLDPAEVRAALREVPSQIESGGRPRGTLIMGALPEESTVIPPKEDDPIIQLLAHSIQQASASILDDSRSNPQYANMGTTSTALLIHEGIAYYGHVGDSRLYRIRNGQVEQISEDHSLVHEHVKAGIINEEEARASQFKNIITRSVGFDPNVAVDTGTVDMRPGDRFLMCSDGLSNLVTDEEIAEIVTQQDMDTALKFHVNLANSRGGDDNITVIIVAID